MACPPTPRSPSPRSPSSHSSSPTPEATARPPVTLRLASPTDGRALASIYAPWVVDTTVSLEEVPPTADQMAERIADTLPRWPWLVAEADEVVGYAYAGPHRGRPGYRWSVEVSAYVDPATHRHGVGTALYTALFAVLERQGHHLALAGIGLPNTVSVGFHEALGFAHVGTLVDVGRKFGSWQDVGWWQRPLGPDRDDVAEPRSLDDLGSEVVARLLR